MTTLLGITRIGIVKRSAIGGNLSTIELMLRKRILMVFSALLILSLVGACGNITSVPTVTISATTAPSIMPFTPSITPSPMPTATPLLSSTFTLTPEPGTPPGCKILNQAGKLDVLSEKEFFAFGPSETKLDEVLVGSYPAWASFEQTVSWYAEPVKVGKIIEAASFRGQYNFNPAVTLVTLGESLGWQIPADRDVYSRALQISEALIRPALDWIKPGNEQIRAQFPQISNGATYALYIFFERDQHQLEAWCHTYQQLFRGFTSLSISIMTPTPDFCSSAQWGDRIRIISEDIFTALEPGGPTLFDHILVKQNPAWANFQQEVHGEKWSAGVTFHETAFGPELGTGVNPAVLLVTYGVDKNWKLPTNGDLRSEVDSIRAVLYQYDLDWILSKVDQTQYPAVANAATYALYRYFNGDLSKLETWCRTYVQVYGESPLKNQ